MARCKYLDELGLERKSYDSDLWGLYDKKGRKNKKAIKRWKNQKKKYGFDSRECYDLRESYARWLYSHLRRFKEDAGKVVVLDSKVEIEKGVEKELIDIINLIIEDTGKYLVSSNNFDENIECLDEAVRLFNIILPYLWW